MNLTKLRKKINLIDTKVVSLLNERAQTSRAIGKVKLDNKKGVYSPNREKEVLERLKALNKGPMSDKALEAIYREVMSCSLSLEKSLNIAHLGQEGAFTYSAARKKFGSQVDYTPCVSIADVFQKVERSDCDYGVVPIENSTEGAVTYTLDLLVDCDLKICAQFFMEISHCLLSKTTLKKIKTVYSNPQVFGQCRQWLQSHMPDVDQIQVASTSEAAEIAKRRANSAAIANISAARVYNLKVIKEAIEDSPHNITRFLLIAKEDVPPTGKDRTSVLFSIKDKVGALHAMLTPFYQNKINLTKIESRPSKKRAWDYYFFVDFEGHRSDSNVKRALSQLENMCKYLKVLGSYPVME